MGRVRGLGWSVRELGCGTDRRREVITTQCPFPGGNQQARPGSCMFHARSRAAENAIVFICEGRQGFATLACVEVDLILDF